MKLFYPAFLAFAFVVNGYAQEMTKAQSRKTAKENNTPVATSAKPATPTYTRFVNPFIGTGGHGHTYPGAAAPFGMMQLGPDTRYEGWDGCSGYHYSDSVIYGFSHTHLSGTGVPDLCDLLVVPQQGKALTDPGYLVKDGYGSKFRHADEAAVPGLYKVKLLKNNIDVRLTVSERSGLHEYTFNETAGKKYILIDLDHRDEVLSADVQAINQTTISGHRHSKGWATKQKLFFYMEFNVPFTKSTLITEGNRHKMLLEFPEATKQILLRTGISAVDGKGAENNLKSEITQWNFETLYKSTDKRWEDELSKIRFSTKENEVMINFYTALYHSYLCPTLFTDADGRYLGNDGQIYTAQNQTQYSVFSLWDTYRAAHPLYTLTQEERTLSFIQSFLNIYKQTKDLPVWELVGNETDCMIGYHSVSVILDAYRKGITGFDTKLALEAMVHTANLNEYGKQQYAKNGYLGTDVEAESVSKTLEYAYDDWCISEFAKELGNDSIYKVFRQRSFNFLNIYDPESKFMRARRGGQWFTPFNPAEVNFNYTEANSWQYSLAAPQHLSYLRQTLGGKDSLESWLDRLFTTESKLDGRHQVDITGLIGQYAHGNEPSHHMAYLYNFTNQPHKTQERVDQILHEMYSNKPDGLSGNEDCGQMSAWYVLSAMGIYPVCPGKPVYTIGRPLQRYASIYLGKGMTFMIRTENNTPENKYIQSMTLNGVAHEKLFITQKNIQKGGELVIVMGPEPNLALAKWSADMAEEKMLPENMIPVPYFTATERTFTNSITTEIKVLNYHVSNTKSDTVFNGFFITYTTDGSEPTASSSRYSKPLTFDKNTVLKAKTFASYKIKNPKNDKTTERIVGNDLPAVSSNFVKADKNISLKLETNYANQYAAGGKNALIDGLRSESKDYRSGEWQGYEGVDAKGTISYDVPKVVKEISVNCLQNTRSWIFMPVSLQIEYSVDGVNFIQLPAVNTEVSPAGEEIISKEITVKLPANTKVKSFRFTAKNRGVCPQGHISAGEKSWIFLDEITIH